PDPGWDGRRPAGALVLGGVSPLGSLDGPPDPLGRHPPPAPASRPPGRHQLTTADIDDLYAHLLRVGGRNARRLSPGTVHRVHVVADTQCVPLDPQHGAPSPP